ncbi:hypothetical protein BFW38_10740 [Terasakiispira papahanaumokuakeensis]|uniref:Uncharacterized protein n=1 Tax=Terasakiispira papahanaumokuakeensis TaxID=197479 RepID=A0A1E2VAT9_9GAMM|nr:hypothetical protein BFW38_10740 [Terasakiispira papahanaumokuakeensis]
MTWTSIFALEPDLVAMTGRLFDHGVMQRCRFCASLDSQRLSRENNLADKHTRCSGAHVGPRAGSQGEIA